MTARLRVGLVGAGVMGANHGRVIAASPHATLAAVVDCDRDRAALLAAGTGAEVSTTADAVHGCDAVVVACPTEYHRPLAVDLLERGIPVLVEKPLAATHACSVAIVEAARAADVALMCGFVERFNAAVATAISLLEEDPLHVVSIRHSPPTPRITTSVVHDLLIHDIDLAIRFLGRHAAIESVVGAAGPDVLTGVSEVADCTLRFTNGAVGTLSASRASQRKIRSVLVSTPTASLDVDLLRQDVTVYRNVRQEQAGVAPGYRAETVVDIPFVRHAGEPLALQFEHFVGLVRGELDPEAERATLLLPHEVAAAVEDTGTPGAARALAPALQEVAP